MELSRLNKYLSIYQLVGFTIMFILLTIYCLIEGRMMVLFIPMVGLLFLPFLIISSFGILKREEHKSKIKKAINIGLLSLVIPSLTLPMFYEEGGLLISSFCIIIAIIVFRFRRYLEGQLIIMNTIGGLLLTTVIFCMLFFVQQNI